jgi:hypothetical protein
MARLHGWFYGSEPSPAADAPGKSMARWYGHDPETGKENPGAAPIPHESSIPHFVSLKRPPWNAVSAGCDPKGRKNLPSVSAKNPCVQLRVGHREGSRRGRSAIQTAFALPFWKTEPPHGLPRRFALRNDRVEAPVSAFRRAYRAACG